MVPPQCVEARQSRLRHATLTTVNCLWPGVMITLPLPSTLHLGRSSKHAFQRAPRAARSARRPRHPHHQEAACATSRRMHSGRPGAQRQRHRRRARSARRRSGCRRRPGAQRPRHRRRARSARRRWQPAAAPPGTQARSALGAERRAQSAERRARGGDQARRRRPGAQRPRHRRSYYNRLHIAVSLEQHITVKLEQYKLGGYCLLAPLKKKGVTSPGPGPLFKSVLAWESSAR